MCTHVWPLKLILTDHRVITKTVNDASDMGVAAKMLLFLKHGCFTHVSNPTTQKIFTITTISRWTPRLVSPIQYPTKCEIWSQSPLLAEHYDVKLKLTFDL